MAALLTHILLLKAGDAKNILYHNRRLYNIHFVFDIFVSSFFIMCSVLCHIVAACSGLKRSRSLTLNIHHPQANLHERLQTL